uniref:Adenylate kinase 5 n=1 Tax=Vombatus ursinus TaxID=29139 RepID=A0A4X2KZ96_VOMUR
GHPFVPGSRQVQREVPFSLLNGLMCYKPEDPVEYLESCLQKVKELGGPEKVKWDTFVGQEKRTLPPLNGGQSRRSFLRNVMPENANFPYRRYDRLPPIHQFSIESDTDLSETAELIEEYEVFDPTRPRPKIILVIGGPGSGKGTQSLKIAERFGFEYISVGELLRKRIHSTSSNRKWSLIAKIITTGELAPQETTITEIKQKLMQMPDEEGIVIDGFPRDVAQAISFEDQICPPDLVVFLACTSQRLKERLLKRAEQQGRPDDNVKATQRRLANFKQNASPLIKYFQEKGLIMTVSLCSDGPAPLGSGIPLFKKIHFFLMFMILFFQFVNYCIFQGDDEINVFGEDTMEGQGCLTQPFLLLQGGPGSGKGTQCEKLVQKYGFTHICAAELVRNELASASERSLLIREPLERGDPVPDIVLELLKDAMAAHLGEDTKVFLIEGYPQEVKQGEEFERRIGQPHLVICMECSADTMTSRLLQRNPDDRAEAVTQRIQTYYQALVAMTAHYEKNTQLHKVSPPESRVGALSTAPPRCPADIWYS